MAYVIPDSPDALLRRKATAEALTEKGYPVSDKTLATKATRGGGPPFRSFGRIPLYRWGEALEWALSRMSAPRGSTSEADAQRAHEGISKQVRARSSRSETYASAPAAPPIPRAIR